MEIRADNAVGSNPAALAVGDIDLDGKLDLVLTNSYFGPLTLYHGRGDGTFLPELLAAHGARTIDLLDLDGDGAPDLLASLFDGGFAVFFNRSGHLDPPQSGGPQGSCSYSFATADINQDGHPDVLCPRAPNGGFSVTFRDGPHWLAASDIAMDERCDLIAVGDLDGDGNPDVVCADQLTGAVTFLRNVGGPPDAYRFEYVTSLLVLSGADDNCQVSSLTVLLNHGLGSFAETLYAVPASTFYIGDINGDGAPDLVFAGTFLNDGSGHFVASADYYRPFGLLAVADLNGDGLADEIDVWAGISLRTREGLTGPDYVDPDSLDLLLASPTEGFPPRVVQCDGSSIRQFEKRDGAWEEFGFAPIRDSYYPLVVDYNNDSIPDLAISGEGQLLVFLADAQGRLARAGAFDISGGYAAGIVSADFNSDGVPDFAFSSGDNTFVLLSTGFLRYRTISLDVVADATQPLAVADFDSDGRVDLAVAGEAGTVVYFNQGNGVFLRGDAFGPRSWAIASADFDGDGLPDVVASSGYSVSLLRNRGDGTFFPAAPVSDSAESGQLGTFVLAASDFNLDGRVDLAAAGMFGTVVYLGGGDGTFASGVRFSQAPIVQLSIADVDGDLRPDLVGNGMVLYNRCLP